MAQGNPKKKAAGVAKKAKTQKKSLGPKKGGRAIKPKKTTTSNVTVVKKKLEVQIKTSIETQVVNQAEKYEHKPLTLVKKPSGGGQGKKKPAKKPSGGQGKKKTAKKPGGGQGNSVKKATINLTIN